MVLAVGLVVLGAVLWLAFVFAVQLLTGLLTFIGASLSCSMAKLSAFLETGPAAKLALSVSNARLALLVRGRVVPRAGLGHPIGFYNSAKYLL